MNTQIFDPNTKAQEIKEQLQKEGMFSYTQEELEEFKEWDVTLMDGLQSLPPLIFEDEWDNIHGDIF